MVSPAIILPEIASAAGQGYLLLPEKAKKGLSAGVNVLGIGLNTFAALPIIIIACIVNMIILSVVFTITLYRRQKAQILAGQLTLENPLTDSLWKGLGLAFISTFILFIVSVLTGGLAVLMMIAVWIFAIIGVTLLSMTNIEFLNDVTPRDGKSYTSGFKSFSIAFWTTFLAGMLISIGITIAIGVLGTKLTKVAADIAAPIASKMGTIGKLVGSQSMLD